MSDANCEPNPMAYSLLYTCTLVSHARAHRSEHAGLWVLGIGNRARLQLNKTPSHIVTRSYI